MPRRCGVGDDDDGEEEEEEVVVVEEEDKDKKHIAGSLPCHPFSQVMTSTDMLSDELLLRQDPWSSTYRAVLGCEEKLRPVCVQVLRADGVPGDSKAEVEDLIENLAEEAEKMAGLSHPNIAQVVGYAKDEDARMGCLIIDWPCGRGLLEEVLRSDKESESFTWRLRVREAAGLVGALSYLHGEGAGGSLHGDVGSRSVLVGISFHCRLMDCGLFRLKRGGRASACLEERSGRGVSLHASYGSRA
ncbi:hypothetical protein GUITHDRAFT_121930 [Guillardia theta CCMP2712]|uniref:Protein kinase domain-containing protein n=1 Tax=Guillardia theta (strain CCMP2712) TaxID=905079 RepID=L1I6K2_GUITC|nr:hypothetical protein GUITHDRAFT_121930 [Guillardia theta CCMP2712]EKX31883.1 hypothetical protein GUITHDRAFT_121930 [Guillardia theta CCMP2712]|eukprot:XP_005818863.1 hypothetical protein GUITHDRAFT_121930 [Guillardia theta CCMP2712]